MLTPQEARMARVRVRERSTVARLAAWQSRRSRLNVAARAYDGERPSFFVGDEVLVDARDEDLVRELVDRHGGEVVGSPKLPRPPKGVERRRDVDMANAPRWARVRFAEHPRDLDVDLDVLASRHGSDGGDVTYSSGLLAALAVLVRTRRGEGRRIGLDVVGEPFAMPLTRVTEGSPLAYPSDPTQWNMFAGRTRMVEAWQLVDSFRQVKGGTPVWIAVCDTEFWLDAAGRPQVAPGQTQSDFGQGVLQWNLVNEGQPAGILTSTTPSPFHGNRVASAALAAVGNSQGAAGSGGLVARPAFFLGANRAYDATRAIQLCVWWGIDVLNMSWGFWNPDSDEFDEDTWVETFDWGADNGLVCIAAAGPGPNNPVVELPDDLDVRPATRTPRTLTVGALDTNDQASARSNFGSSVNLWAPGTGIQVAPDAAQPFGTTVNGTSFAAPLVSGVAAMMRYCNPDLTADDVRRMLVETGWQGSGRVSRGLDAAAAVRAALNSRLPDTHEDNSTPSRAYPLLPIGPGRALTMGRFSAISSATDRDYWSFDVPHLSDVVVVSEWYARLATLMVVVESASTNAVVDLDRADIATGGVRLTGVLPAGAYRVRVRGDDATAYRLLVHVDEADLGPDEFEPSNSFEEAPVLTFEAAPRSPFQMGWVLGRREWGPGTYPATLHRATGSGPLGSAFVNRDIYRLEVPHSTVFREPTLTIRDSDEPLTVELLDADRRVLRRESGVTEATFRPPPESVGYLRVTGSSPTRYVIVTGLKVRSGVLPGPLQEELQVIPKYWGDPPPWRIRDEVTHWAVDLGRAEVDDGVLAFDLDDPAGEVLVELLDESGEVVRRAYAVAGEDVGARAVLDVADVDPGTKVLRVTRARAAGAAQVRAVPPPVA
jgi:hypothetical protein